MSSDYQTLWIETTTTRYPIYIGKRLNPFSIIGDSHAINKALIVTDDVVSNFHRFEFSQFNKINCIEQLILPHGEPNKNIDQLRVILDKLMTKAFHRDDLMIAFGGGVVGDISSLAASLFHRGMRLWQFPTTLLAQVDSAVGGKTAVNYGGVKNSIGTFYQPEAVYCDVNYLSTLSDRAYLSAFGEVVKYALLTSSDFFDYLSANVDSLVARSPLALQQVVVRCCQIKAAIVAQDEKEQGIRALLNLGHTFAHAIESSTCYQQYYHGEAVSIGLVLAAKLSSRLGYLSEECVNLISKLLQKFGLPTTLSAEIDSGSLLSLLKHDKKVRQSKVRFVLLSNIGEAFVDTVGDEGCVRGVLSEVRGS